MPSGRKEKAKLAEKLQEVGIGLTAYARSFEETDSIRYTVHALTKYCWCVFMTLMIETFIK